MDPYGHPIKPMLAEMAREPFDSSDHFFELKWDGTRAICFSKDGHRFQNRRLNDITHRYPEIRVRTHRDAILDGEVVVMHNGIPSFEKLQEREHTSGRIRIDYLSRRIPATYVVFDVLYIEKEDVTALPLDRRRELLKDLVVLDGNVVLSDVVEGQGIDFFRAVVDRGLEGILAKRRDSRYRIGRRSRDWVKIKKSTPLDAIVCGLSEGFGERASSFGALILGVYRGGVLTYVGRVGTGFDDRTRAEILERLRGLEGPCPFPDVPEMDAPVKSWTKPSLVCEVRFLEFSKDGRLRAPSFGRIRPDKDPRECVVD